MNSVSAPWKCSRESSKAARLRFLATRLTNESTNGSLFQSGIEEAPRRFPDSAGFLPAYKKPSRWAVEASGGGRVGPAALGAPAPPRGAHEEHDPEHRHEGVGELGDGVGQARGIVVGAAPSPGPVRVEPPVGAARGPRGDIERIDGDVAAARPAADAVEPE